MSSQRRIGFVTNICPHYRVRTFEALAKKYDVDYYFFSAGDDWYWQEQHGVRVGDFKYRNVPGFRIGGTRITPGLPLTLWRERYDVYVKCINGRFALPAAYLAARLARKPFILWTGVWMRIDTTAHRLLYPITRYLYRHADAVVAYGDHVRRFLEAEGVSTDRIFIAPHAVDNDQYNRAISTSEVGALQDTLRVSSNHRVVLFVGRLEKEKGLDFLLRAFAALDAADAILVLAGDGSERRALEALSQQLGIADRVRFPGYIPPDATVRYYAMAYVYVLPSITTKRFKEPWGLVVNEAFNQGLPVIATDAVGAAAGGLIQDGYNGLIVREQRSDVLAQALRRILESPALRESLSANARSTIQPWDNERMVGGFAKAIEYVLRRSENATLRSTTLQGDGTAV